MHDNYMKMDCQVIGNYCFDLSHCRDDLTACGLVTTIVDTHHIRNPCYAPDLK